MIDHFLLICSSIIVYEFIIYIKFINIIKSNLKIYQKILKLFIAKNISDLRKEKLIFIYSKLLFFISIKIFLIIILILFFIYMLNFFSQSFLNLILSLFGVLQLSVMTLIYHQFRKKINAKL